MTIGNESFYRQYAQFLDAKGVADRRALGHAIVTGAFPDRQAFDEHVPAKLRRVIIKCLEPKRVDRFGSALAAANALAAVDGSLDWRLERGTLDKVWTKNETGTTKRFAVRQDGSTTFTTTADGAKSRRKNDLCRERMTRREIETTLKQN